MELGSHSIEAARSGWGRFREGSSKVYKDVSETELAKKGHELGSQVSNLRGLAMMLLPPTLLTPSHAHPSLVTGGSTGSEDGRESL